MITDAAKFPGFPTDQAKNRGKPGDSARLKWTLHPMKVNSRHIHMIKRCGRQ